MTRLWSLLCAGSVPFFLRGCVCVVVCVPFCMCAHSSTAVSGNKWPPSKQGTLALLIPTLKPAALLALAAPAVAVATVTAAGIKSGRVRREPAHMHAPTGLCSPSFTPDKNIHADRAEWSRWCGTAVRAGRSKGDALNEMSPPSTRAKALSHAGWLVCTHHWEMFKVSFSFGHAFKRACKDSVLAAGMAQESILSWPEQPNAADLKKKCKCVSQMLLFFYRGQSVDDSH